MSNNKENSEKFDINVVKENFEAALHDADDVKLQEYLDSFEELNKFFTLMGAVFSFVSKDLKEKMDILRKFLNESEEFSTAKGMIEYEKSQDLLFKKGHVSGSRTLLRIHRGLDFIQSFLSKLKDLENEESTSTACREAYDQTLSQFHPFIIRNGARLAIYTLPTKANLLNGVCGTPKEVERALELLPKTLEATGIVYERIQNLYSTYDLHKLP